MNALKASTAVGRDAITATLEAFASAWQKGEEPLIADYMPPRPWPGPPSFSLDVTDPDSSTRQTHSLLVELVKLDMDERGRAGLVRPLEAYLDEFPELGPPDSPPLALIHEELHLARGRGETLEPTEACRRFPGRATEIRRWIRRWRKAFESTAVLDVGTASEPLLLAPGTWIDEFEILDVLGRGSFATVYRARQTSLDRIVALKVSGDRGDEARTLAQLDHPNVVRVFDQRRLADQRLLLVYEQFLPGGSLAPVVELVRHTPPAARSGALLAQAVTAAASKVGSQADPTSGQLGRIAATAWPVTVAKIGEQLASALAHAHQAGVLHRDVKPTNVLLSAHGTVHLADFNLSHLADHRVNMAAAHFGGSLSYMPPEQLEAFDRSHPRRPDELDGRVDIYALAVLLWELLAGQRPYGNDRGTCDDASGQLREMIDRRHEPPAPLPMEVARDAADLVEVLQGCLQGNRDLRPAHASDVAARLAALTRPSSRRLLAGRRTNIQSLAARYPIAAVATCVLVPNTALGIFNYDYNRRMLVEIYRRPDISLGQFQAIESALPVAAACINAVTFPLAFLLVWLLTRPWVLGGVAGDRGVAPVLHCRARRVGLLLGDAAAWIGVAAWILGGLMFQLLISWQVGCLPPEVPLLFMQSPVACGLLASAYPFFLTTLFVLEILYPSVLEPGEVLGEEERRAVEWLPKRSGWYLVVAAGVPLITLGMLLVLGSTDRPALMLLTVAGIVALLVSRWAHEKISRDASFIVEATSSTEHIADDSVLTTRRASDSPLGDPRLEYRV